MHVFNITDQKNVTLDGFTIRDVCATLSATELNVQVNAGETRPVYKILAEKPGSIKVTSKPPGANIYLDGRHKGKTPDTITEVSPGHHTTKLTLDSYRDWSTNLQVRAGETSDVAAIMIPSFTQAGIYMKTASLIMSHKHGMTGQIIIGLVTTGLHRLVDRAITLYPALPGAKTKIRWTSVQ